MRVFREDVLACPCGWQAARGGRSDAARPAAPRRARLSHPTRAGKAGSRPSPPAFHRVTPRARPLHGRTSGGNVAGRLTPRSTPSPTTALREGPAPAPVLATGSGDHAMVSTPWFRRHGSCPRRTSHHALARLGGPSFTPTRRHTAVSLVRPTTRSSCRG